MKLDNYYLGILMDNQHDAEIKFYLEKRPKSIIMRTNPIDGELLINGSNNFTAKGLKVEQDGNEAVWKGLETCFSDIGFNCISFTTNKKDVQKVKIHLIIELEDEIEDLSFTEKVIKTLKEEAEILDEARKSALKRGSHSDYKLLINNYREIIKLIQELERHTKPQEINVKFDFKEYAKNIIPEIISEINKDTLNKGRIQSI